MVGPRLIAQPLNLSRPLCLPPSPNPFKVSAMPRIPYKTPAPGTSVIGDAIRERRGARGLTPLDQALLNAPEIAVRFQ